MTVSSDFASGSAMRHSIDKGAGLDDSPKNAIPERGTRPQAAALESSQAAFVVRPCLAAPTTQGPHRNHMRSARDDPRVSPVAARFAGVILSAA